jgi:adenylate cyclase
MAWYRRAYERATALGARTIQLQAASRLVRLGSRPGDDAAAARRDLDDVYGWFTEGFSTHDLIEAREALGGDASAPFSAVIR